MGLVVCVQEAIGETGSGGVVMAGLPRFTWGPVEAVAGGS